MPLPFSVVCELLDEAYARAVSRKEYGTTVRDWFRGNRSSIHAEDTSLNALLSTLLPGMRSDRVYNIQVARLEKIAGRGLCLGSSRVAELARYRTSEAGGDLADCVERVLSVTPNFIPSGCGITIEEIDELLHDYAAGVIWSSPSIRATSKPSTRRTQRDLEQVFGRLTPLEGKWFTRLILKNFEPLTFSPAQVFRECHPQLPIALRVREDFSAALTLIQSHRGQMLSPQTDKQAAGEFMISNFVPRVGTKVARQTWAKARSIKHCLNLGHGRVSVEYKADGEYCQIHVDLSKGWDNLKIFSKSGKDSTEDRESLHSTIRSSLNIGNENCQFQKACILEGELLVFCDLEKKILPFHRIRNHVTRRGRFLNTDADDRVTPYEHLMILYYDILLVDDRSLLHVRHSERMKLLSSIVQCQPGHAELVSRELVDFDHPLAASNLRNIFASTITRKEEGLVLKMDVPYVDFFEKSRSFVAQCIKLKKEYIGSFGEVGDFAVVGAGYDAQCAKQYSIAHLKWTHFYIGCLTNKEEVKQWSQKPKFTVVKMVEVNERMLKSVVQFGSPVGVPRDENTQTELFIHPGVEMKPKLTVVFTNPMVFDMRCFSFDRDGNTGFWSLRFPSVAKVHFDRDWGDSVTFDELQGMAVKNTTAPALPDSQENLEWIAKLERADPRGIAVDAISQQTATTISEPSVNQSFDGRRQTTSEPTNEIGNSKLGTGDWRQSEDVSYPTCADYSHSRPTKQVQLDCTTGHQNAKCKRQSESIHGPDEHKHAHKRNKPLSIEQDITNEASQSHKRQHERQPLVDITGNSSQARTIISISSQEPEGRQPEVIDLTLSPEAAHASKGTGKLKALDMLTVPECEPGSTVSSANNSTAKDSNSGPKTGRRENDPGLDAEDDGQVDIPPLEEVSGNISATVLGQGEAPGCKYAGQDCQLYKSTFVLVPSLANDNAQLSGLLETHGAHHITINVEEWLKHGREPGKGKPPNMAQSETMILVDSLSNANEMETILARIEEGRRALPKSRRRWIRIYDWRALEYVSILEDEKITKKYYDGFSDPWTRWYCGLV